MSAALIVPLALKTSILAIVFALGLAARPGDLIYLFKRPSELARSLLAMSVVMPIVAVLLVRMMDLSRPAAIMLVALSLAPVPPILPRKQAKAHGHAAYSIGLLVAAALVSLLWIPLALEGVERMFGVPLGIPLAAVGTLVATTILIPLLAGVVAGQLFPDLASRLASIVSRLGGLLLLVVIAAILATNWRTIFGHVHDGVLFAIGVFVIVGLLTGHLLGGPAPNDRTVLAMATASRHPGVALAIAHINFPNEKSVAAAVLLYLLANALLSLPYVAWRKRADAAPDLTLP